MLFDTKIEHRTEPKRPIPEMLKEYQELLESTGRPGVKRLLGWLQSDMGNGTLNFLQAPASTRFHNSFPGGLLEHTLNVYHWMMALFSYQLRQDCQEAQLNDEDAATANSMIESVKIVALLHDLCKVGFYKEEWVNKKVRSENGSKQDKGGRFDWVEVQQYRVTDTHKFGHGAASIEIAERFLGIDGMTDAEKYAIRYHMGDFTNERETGDIYNRYPLATLLHMADLGATYLDERECDDSGDIFWANLSAYARTVRKKPKDGNEQGGNNDGQTTEST